jgi:hypothetical protein
MTNKLLNMGKKFDANFEIVHNYNFNFFQSETSVSQDDPVFEKKCSGLVSSIKKYSYC